MGVVAEIGDVEKIQMGRTLWLYSNPGTTD